MPCTQMTVALIYMILDLYFPSLTLLNEDVCDMSYTQWQSQSFTSSSETPLTKRFQGVSSFSK